MKIEVGQNDVLEFGKMAEGLSNTQILEKIYTEQNVASKLKKSDDLYLYKLVDAETKVPLISFIYNKGFMKGKTLCVFFTHIYKGNTCELPMSTPYTKVDEEWVDSKFRTKAREMEFRKLLDDKIFRTGIIWK
jgi:hypothetical protein